jgi:subtilisin family serine protease
MSFGFHAYSHDIYSALDYASKRGIVMLAAASNDGRQAENPIAYPAGELGMVICINAANPWGGVSVFNPPRATNRDNFTILGENVKSAWPGRIRKKDVFEDGKGTWKRASGTSVATPIAAALTASLMQFGRMRQRLIRPHYRKLESYGGIRQIFAKMTLDKNRFLPPDGFDNIVPGLLLRTQYWDPKDLISTKISEELMKY